MNAARMGNGSWRKAPSPYQAALSSRALLLAMGVSAVASTDCAVQELGNVGWVVPPFAAFSRTFQGLPVGQFADGRGLRSPTAANDEGILLVMPAQATNSAIDEVLAFRSLPDGWDGERARAPRRKAVNDAVRFLLAAGEDGSGLEPTLHADGSVILEIGDGAQGSFTFRGDRRVICAVEGSVPQTVAFEGRRLPPEVRSALVG